MESSKLVIIGNGFDRYNDLPTLYSDFHQYIAENVPELEDRLYRYFEFNVDADYLWKDFENDLSSYDFRAFYAAYDHTDISSDTFKPSEAYGLEDEIEQEIGFFIDEIRENFGDWIDSIEFQQASVGKKGFRFSAPVTFINFNYTNTLETYYNVAPKDILYIHGNVQEYSGGLIFGHGQSLESEPKEDELDEEGNSNRTIFTDAEDHARSLFYEFKKPTDEVLEENTSFFESLSNITEVIVLGHSLGRVDWPYFQEVSRKFPSALWQVSYHKEGELDDLRGRAMRMLGNTCDEIRMVKIEDFVV